MQAGNNGRREPQAEIESNEVKIAADMTDDGFTSPVFRARLPPILKDAGMSEKQWSELIAQANVGVAYQWLPICCNPCCVCCFFCNCHNKRIKIPMNKLCETWNGQSGPDSLLPREFKVRYEMTTTTVRTHVTGGGSAATLDVHHCLIFSCRGEGAEIEAIQR
mmetsp:Transcript_25598/g.43149  ORF Transcript_25598/g.43149 Transcript_25598/m.43149 type:complete len:163 (+) Transcript_25598:56-544(+)